MYRGLLLGRGPPACIPPHRNMVRGYSPQERCRGRSAGATGGTDLLPEARIGDLWWTKRAPPNGFRNAITYRGYRLFLWAKPCRSRFTEPQRPNLSSRCRVLATATFNSRPRRRRRAESTRHRVGKKHERAARAKQPGANCQRPPRLRPSRWARRLRSQTVWH